MRTYDSYKDSGIEWIGEIPRHWELVRLKNTGSLYSGLSGKSGDDFRDEDNPKNRYFIPFTNIFRNTYITQDNLGQVVIQEGETQNRVQRNDIFFLMSSEDYEDLGKTSILTDDYDELYLNSFCKGLRVIHPNVYPLYLNFQLSGYTHKKLISIEGSGFTRINLRQDKLLTTPVLLPPISEQEQIVSYLDEKTSLIDEMVEKKKRKIELLKEYRTSLINTVVTKGLNPDVPMKDSGIEWIGEIPRHWELKRLKYISEIIPSNVDKHIFEDEIQVELCNYTDVYKNDKIDSNTILSKGSCNTSEYEKYHVKLHDVIITKDSESPDDIGIPCLISEQLQGVVCGYHLTMLRPTSVDGRYLFSYLLSNFTKSYFFVSSNGMTRYGLGKSSIEDLFTTLPPLSEQEQIVSYLDEKTSEIDKTIELENKKIELLNEYRKSLISNVVTGKIKVVSE